MLEHELNSGLTDPLWIYLRIFLKNLNIIILRGLNILFPLQIIIFKSVFFECI